MGSAGSEKGVTNRGQAIRTRLEGTRRSGRHAIQAIAMVWKASRPLTAALAAMTLVAALGRRSEMGARRVRSGGWPDARTARPFSSQPNIGAALGHRRKRRDTRE